MPIVGQPGSQNPPGRMHDVTASLHTHIHTHTHTLGAGDTDWERGKRTPKVEGAGWREGQAAGQTVEGTTACRMCQCSASPAHSRSGRRYVHC